MGARRWLRDIGPDLLVLAVATTHVLLTPYTKVEASFLLHAPHEFLHHGVIEPHHLDAPAKWPDPPRSTSRRESCHVMWTTSTSKS